MAVLHGFYCSLVNQMPALSDLQKYRTDVSVVLVSLSYYCSSNSCTSGRSLSMDCSFPGSQAAIEANSFNDIQCISFITLGLGSIAMDCAISMGESSNFPKS